MENLQQSTSSQKLEIQQRLAPFDISSYKSKFDSASSANYDFSKFSDHKAFGSELDLDLIYDGRLDTLNEIKSNFTLEIMKEVMSVIEFGSQFDNLPQMLKSYLNSESGTEFSLLKNMIEYFLNQQDPSTDTSQIDMFLKLFGTEVIYVSASNQDGKETTLPEVRKYLKEALDELRNIFLSKTERGYYVRHSLVIPTIQGTPLLLKEDYAHVSSMNRESKTGKSPALSGIFSVFAGYDFGPSVAFKAESRLSVGNELKISLNGDSEDFSLKYDLPRETGDLVKIDYFSTFYTQKPGEAERHTDHSNTEPIQNSQKCFESFVKLCIETRLPDDPLNFFQRNYHYLKLSVKKTDPAVNSYEIQASRNNEGKIKVGLLAHGAQVPQKMAVEIDYTRDSEPQTVSASLDVLENKYYFKALRKQYPHDSNLKLAEIYFGSKNQGIADKKVNLFLN